jgi:hypothetical protein
MHDLCGPLILGLSAIFGLVSMKTGGQRRPLVCAAIVILVALIAFIPVRLPASNATTLSGWALAAATTFVAQGLVIRRLLRDRRAMLALADRVGLTRSGTASGD